MLTKTIFRQSKRGTSAIQKFFYRLKASLRFAAEIVLANSSLGQCNRVGFLVRAKGGVPKIVNEGYCSIGKKTVLRSLFDPIQLSVNLDARVTIGDRCYINSGCVLKASMEITIGNRVSLGPYCYLSDREESIAGGDVNVAPIVIEDGVWLATRVTIMPGVRIGSGSVITAGSVVFDNIPEGVIAGGVPARILRRLEKKPSAALTQPELLSAHLAGDRSLLVQSSVDRKLTTAMRDSEGDPTDRLLILSDFTVDELSNCLTRSDAHARLEVQIAPFQQVIKSLLEYKVGDATYAVVWTLPEIAIPSFARLVNFEEVKLEVILEEVRAFTSLLISQLMTVKGVVIPTWTTPSSYRGLGAIDLRPGGVNFALMKMNAVLISELVDQRHIYVLDTQRWIARVGPAARHPKLWFMGKVAFSHDVMQEAADDIYALIDASRGKTRKLLVLDLDDTLWGGILGDLGWEGIRLGGHDSVGEAFVEFQQAVKALKNRGILLAIASKNTESIALEAIRSNQEMVLQADDFAAFRINWSDKAKNISEIAQELNLGLQSVVFIDDNPVERARVRDALPEVYVPDWPADVHFYVTSLQGLPCFDSASISAEDLKRTEMIQAEKSRELSMPAIGSVDDWIRSLDMTLVASPVAASTLGRTVQLLNKTNQLNLSTRRVTENELAEWLKSSSRQMWVMHVSDRYGDSGLTGVVSVEVEGTDARIIDYVLSCRVMGRKVEESLLHVAIASAYRSGADRVIACFIPTKKNGPCLDVMSRSGFSKTDANIFEWNTSNPYPLSDAISLRIESPTFA